jgi:hypothetical protein
VRGRKKESERAKEREAERAVEGDREMETVDNIHVIVVQNIIHKVAVKHYISDSPENLETLFN